jgi:hypothetical protein
MSDMFDDEDLPERQMVDPDQGAPEIDEIGTTPHPDVLGRGGSPAH